MIIEIVKRVLENLVAYGKRSMMTVLGIMWGIASFILLIAYGDGFQNAMMLGLRYFGDNVVVVWNGQTSMQAGGARSGRVIRTQPEDAEMIRQRCTLVKRVSPEVYDDMQLRWGDRMTTAGIRAVNDEYGPIRGMFMAEGRFLNSEDMAYMRRVVVLGYDLKKKLFSQAPALDQDIVMEGVRFTVIGVLRKKIAISNYFTQDDYCALIPVNVMGTMRDIRYNSVMVFQPVSGAMEDAAVRQVMTVLGEIHKFNPADGKALIMQRFSMVFGIINGLSMATKGLLNVIGLFTLAVAGVGIMNIMLFCVQERTHEIGVLKALGARKRHIRIQFLGEALALSIIGGILGYLLAILLANWIGAIPFLSDLFEDKSRQGDIHVLVDTRVFFTSFVTFAVIGLLSGTWPAIKASRLDPVEALRTE
ncbi:MAG TPA: ABC transporter permease [Acidobacteriota bacterium]|nr:ABC transporter permease [Acidobacteriota bacterium]